LVEVDGSVVVRHVEDVAVQVLARRGRHVPAIRVAVLVPRGWWRSLRVGVAAEDAADRVSVRRILEEPEISGWNPGPGGGSRAIGWLALRITTRCYLERDARLRIRAAREQIVVPTALPVELGIAVVLV